MPKSYYIALLIVVLMLLIISQNSGSFIIKITLVRHTNYIHAIK